MLLSPPIYPTFNGLKCSVFGRFGALQSILIHGIIKTDEAGTLDFSGVPALFVTTVLIVQCSTAYNVHHFEPLFHQFHGGFQFVQSLMIIDPVSRVFGHMTH